MKKKFIVLIFSCVYILGCQKHKYYQPDHITLTWTDNPHNTQTITWRTDTLETSGAVQYTNVEDSADFRSKEIYMEEDSYSRLKTEVGTWNIHTITINHLESGKTYCYRVGSKNNWSAKSVFTTESKETKNFSFLIFGDSQSGKAKDTNYSIFGTTIHNAYKANPDSKFFINMGDLVEIGGYYKHWNNWFNAVKDIINKIPFMPVQGNHETYYDSLYNEGKPTNFIGQFNLPQGNVPDYFKGQIYSYNYGDVHFAVWDSQIEEEMPNKEMLNKELDWLRKDLKKTDRIWKVVLFHKTPYYNKMKRSNDTLRKLLQPIIDSNHVDIVLNGHDHGISWTYPIKNDEYESKPSQGTVYYITGRSGNKRYDDLVSKVWDANFYDPHDEPNYVVANVNSKQFKLIAFNQDATPIDTFIIDKSKDEIYPAKVPVKYNKTELVIFGKLITELAKPINHDNKWYISANAFVNYLHGEITKKNNTLKIDIGKTSAEFSIKHFQQNVDMISADEIKSKLGFNYKYDESMNMLMFSKD